MIARTINILSQIVNRNPTWSPITGLGKVYEMWVLSELALMLQPQVQALEVRDSNNARTQTFIQSGSPHDIHPRRNNPLNLSHIWFCTREEREFEIHLGVRFEGRSTAKHEFDICVLPYDIVEHYRGLTQKGRPFGHPKVGIELKEYGKNIGVGLARNYLATIFDCTFWKQPRTFTSASPNQFNPPQHDLIGYSISGNNKKGKLCMITNASFSSGANAISKKYNIHMLDHVQLGQPLTSIHSLVQYIANLK